MSASAFFIRAVRAFAGAAGGLGVLTLGAWLGGAWQPAHAVGGPFSRMARDTEETSRSYPNKSTQPPLSPNGKRARPDPSADVNGEIPLGDVLAVNGQPMQLSIFTTRDGPETVTRYYSDAFQKRGLLPVGSADANSGHVSVFSPNDGLQRFINALPQADGETLVMVGITNPRNAPKLLDGAKDAPFPVPEENRGFLGYASEDAGARAQSGQYLSPLSVAAIQAFYRKELLAAGFHEQAGGSPAFSVFLHGNVSISVAAQALSEKSGAAVFVNRVEGSSAREGAQ